MYLEPIFRIQYPANTATDLQQHITALKLRVMWPKGCGFDQRGTGSVLTLRLEDNTHRSAHFAYYRKDRSSECR